MTTKINFGHYYDFRNPARWRRPWAEFYAELLDFICYTETLGFGGAWFSEHHMAEDGYIPSPLVVASAVAARTKHLVLGTSIAIAPLYHPVRFAEDCAIIDIISNGRFQVAVGSGYRQRELAAYGADFSARGAYVDEFVQIVRRLWDGETVTHRGQHFNLDSAFIMPRPVQDHLPLFIGGYNKRAFRRAARYGDGYLGSLECYPAYMEQVRACGTELARARFGEIGFSLYVSRDPEKMFNEIAEHSLYTNNSTASWMNEGKAGGVFATEVRSDPMDMETFRRQGLLKVMTPDQAIDYIRARLKVAPIENFFTNAPPAGYPLSKFAESAELFAKEVIPAFI
jgi:alkanesulfonate monooxygenase SsuD/methylene tetrahydromethanopterin reductase-like flavin-dependent oxidoreductase (luciferase family)